MVNREGYVCCKYVMRIYKNALRDEITNSMLIKLTSNLIALPLLENLRAPGSICRRVEKK